MIRIRLNWLAPAAAMLAAVTCALVARAAHRPVPQNAPGASVAHPDLPLASRGRDPVVRLGELLPDLAAHDERGRKVKLRQLNDGYTVLVFGCVTCPLYMAKLHEMESLCRDFSSVGVKFFYLHTEIIHPEKLGLLEPYTLKERLLYLEEARATTGSEIPWLCDTVERQLHKAFGTAPNTELVVSPEGRIVRFRAWNNPAQLRRDLTELTGRSVRPTNPEDIELVSRPHLREISPRASQPRGLLKSLTAARIIAQVADDSEPFFAKLTVAADRQLLDRDRGRLYMRLDLDPLYRMQWNSSMLPVIAIQMSGRPGVSRVLRAPPGQRQTDVESREYLVDLDLRGSDRVLQISIAYGVDSLLDGSATRMAQSYTVSIESAE